MARVSPFSNTPPAAVENILTQVGKNIRIARLRRQMRLIDLAERVGVSRYVMSDIEKGKPTTAVGSYVTALWILGLTDDLYNLGNPDKDIEGRALESARAPKTAPKRQKELDNDF